MELVDRLDSLEVAQRLAVSGQTNENAVQQLLHTGVKLVSTSAALEDRFYDALRELVTSIHTPAGLSEPILYEGANYPGCWLESTGSISAERLARFFPETAKATFLCFSRWQRDDGLVPYTVGEQGARYSQIQAVSPLARSVWHFHQLYHPDVAFLRTMYDSMAAYDQWLAKYRDTRNTGAVEAFCVWDTGHDMSPRFWHIPDMTPHRDAATCWDLPGLPYVAPDLTAFVYAQRKYLSHMAEELGRENEAIQWQSKAAATYQALWQQCFDPVDACFYDRDAEGNFVRVVSDVLLRVLADEAAPADVMESALRRYLLHPRKFFARYPLTSLAMDDPRFDHDFTYNTWGGATNFLSLLRAPDAFEYFGHHVELTWLMGPAIAALIGGTSFAQGMNPWTGAMGYGRHYSPAMLTLLDFIERLCGILPASQALWFSANPVIPYQGSGAIPDIAYRRVIDDVVFDLVVVAEGRAYIFQQGIQRHAFPLGLRLITDRTGHVRALVGTSHRPITGTVMVDGRPIEVNVGPNQVHRYVDRSFVLETDPGLVMPRRD